MREKCENIFRLLLDDQKCVSSLRENENTYTRQQKNSHKRTQSQVAVCENERKRETAKIARSRFLDCVKVCERERVKNFVNKCESEEESGKEEHDGKKGEGVIEFVWWNPEPKKVFFFGSDPNCGKWNKQQQQQRVLKDKDQIPPSRRIMRGRLKRLHSSSSVVPLTTTTTTAVVSPTTGGDDYCCSSVRAGGVIHRRG